ncbi:hypothetical protein ACOMHN_029670 [Nucella lapillus]
MPSAENSPSGAYIAGALGGAAGVIVGHPFDTTKVQLQLHKGEMNTQGTIAYIQKQGLARGFFRGLSFPLLSYAAINSVFFGVYNYALRVLHTDPLHNTPSYWTVLAAGSLGGAAQLLVACPSDVVKVVLQSQIPETRGTSMPLVPTGTGSSLTTAATMTASASASTSASASARYYNGPRECIRHLMRQGGVPGLFRGMGAMAARDVPGYGIYLVVFEYVDQLMHRHGYTDPQGIFSNIMAGGLAGSVSWAIILPLDVIKSRIQADEERKYKGFWDCVVKSWREEGPRAFSRGLMVCSVRGFPSAAITFLVYSQTLKAFNDANGVS